jgi:hypothetical protein
MCGHEDETIRYTKDMRSARVSSGWAFGQRWLVRKGSSLVFCF